MERYRYPIITRPLPNSELLWAFNMVDPSQAIAATLDKIKTELRRHLQQQWQEWHWLPDGMRSAKLKTHSVAIRPVYVQKTEQRFGEMQAKRFPAAKKLSLPIHAVYGVNEYDQQQCFLPDLGLDFYYYDEAQLKSLITHFVEDYFANFSPEALHRYVHLTPPGLEWVEYRVPTTQQERQKSRPQVDEGLRRVAEPWPYKAPRNQKTTATAGQTAWELEDCVKQLLTVLNSGGHALVVGENGSGKSTVLADAAKQWQQQHRTKKLDKPLRSFWQTDGRRMQAGARYLGEWQENVENLMDILEQEQQVLWLNDLLNLTHTGGEGPQDSMAAYLIPHMASQRFQVVGEVTPSELEKLFEQLPSLAELFQTIRIPALGRSQILSLAEKTMASITSKNPVQASEQTLNTAYRLMARFMRQAAFPGKLLSFLHQVVQQAISQQKTILTEQDINQQFMQNTGLPEWLLRDDQPLDLAALQAHFQQRIVGQPQAIDNLQAMITILKTGLNHPDKPIATLLFAGPTGVGKTACAKALSEYLFGHSNQSTAQPDERLIRLDMSEFQHPGQMHRLLGTVNRPSRLISTVRQHPFCVVLLDEIEKAHPIFFDALMNILDAGRLTDAIGRVTDFRNCIIIMTSNLGAVTQSVGFTPSGHDNTAIKQFFRPEFFNRIDEVVHFNALDTSSIEQITRYELDQVKQREGLVEHGIRLHFSDALINHLSQTGFDPEYGARPLQRQIEQDVTANLGRWLLKVKPAAGAWYCDWQNHELTLSAI